MKTRDVVLRERCNCLGTVMRRIRFLLGVTATAGMSISPLARAVRLMAVCGLLGVPALPVLGQASRPGQVGRADEITPRALGNGRVSTSSNTANFLSVLCTGFEGTDGWDLNQSVCGDEFGLGLTCSYPVPNVCVPKNHAASRNCCHDDPNEETGWYMSSTSQHCSFPGIRDIHPAAGMQHLRFQYDPAGGSPSGCSGFLPSCQQQAITSHEPVPVLSTTRWSYDIAVSGTGGSTMIVETGEHTPLGGILLTSQTKWDSSGALFINDNLAGPFIQHANWALNSPGYANYTIVFDPCNHTVTYSYGGVAVRTEAYGPTRPLTTDMGIYTTDHQQSQTIDIDCHCATHVPCGACGNNLIDAGEECDGTDDAACPGGCQSYCMCPQAVCGCVPAPSGMVAWWPLDETAGATSLQDIIGGNDATPVTSPVGGADGPQSVPGVVQGAMHFPKFPNGASGASVASQTGALVSIGSADFTLDAWVNFAPGAPADKVHYIVNRFGSNKGLAFYIVSPAITANERLEFQWGDGTTSSTVQTISPMTPGWHHVAVTFTRSAVVNPLDIRLYVDGLQQGQQSGPLPGTLVNFGFVNIGSQPSAIDLPITIDELEIFDRALTQPEVKAIYQAGSDGKCKCTDPPSDMVAWWPLDETGPSTAEDIAGTNDGTQVCAVTFGPGKVDGAYGLTRAGSARSFVGVPDDPSLDFGSGSFTIDAWIYPEPCSFLPLSSPLFCYPRPIVSKRQQHPTQGEGYEFSVEYAPGGSGGALGLFLGGTPPPSQTILSSVSPVVDSQWQHIAVRVDRSANLVTFFYNGTPLGNSFSLPASGVVDNNFSLPLFLGYGPSNITPLPCPPATFECSYSHYFNGWLDEIEIFKRPLVEAEIAAIYRAGANGKCKPDFLALNVLRERKKVDRVATNLVGVTEQREGPIDICPCAGASDCDDGLFCNGEETCDLAASQCQDSDPPCAADFLCDEENDTCLEAIPTVSQWGLAVLTLLLLIGGKIYFARPEPVTA